MAIATAIRYAGPVVDSGGPGLTDAAFHILLALADRERHGYEILQVVDRDSGMAGRLGTTTLYRTIRNLLRDGLVEESGERPDPELDDQRRRYYRLTPTGRAAARAEIERLRRILAAAESTTLVRRRSAGLAH
jgi:DNA-binding PadR family transcriptional regulator